MQQTRTIAIIGGGISGLAAAYEACKKSSAKVVLFEASDRLGGVLQTEMIDGFLVDHSADMFVVKPTAAFDLIKELGHADKLIGTIPVEPRAYVAVADAIHPIPAGLSLMLPTDMDSVLQSKLLDDEGKQRFLAEEKILPRMDESDECLYDFAVRRFGVQFFERLIQPLVSGIYTADPKKLSMHATMMRFVEMEREHGSLINAGKAKSLTESTESQASGARYDLFRAPAQGMGQIVEWLVAALGQAEIRTGVPVKSVFQSNKNWVVRTDSGDEKFSDVVLATSASVAGEMLKSDQRELSGELSQIAFASSAVVVMGIEDADVARPFSGYGIIVPANLNRQVIATSFSSHKFEGRAPMGKTLVRSFIGGALAGERVDLTDEELCAIAVDELKKTIGYSGVPEFTRVFRWRNSMPQYEVGHLDRVARIQSLVASLDGLALAGKSYSGVGIPACIESGSAAIESLNKG